jgi:two-component system, LytTR family, response regulator
MRRRGGISPLARARGALRVTRLRAIVVDDEPLAREGLAAELRALDVDVVAECADGFAAVEAVRQRQPELLLLDIAMPELDGFAVLDRLEPEEVPAAVIFVTAFDAHALRAFDAQALDYLLKPVATERLTEAVTRAERRVAEAAAHRRELAESASPLVSENGDAQGQAYLTQLLIRDHRGTLIIPVRDIEWIEADAYYARLHMVDGARPRLLRERMSVLERRLDPSFFFRTHRSAIVRLARVREIRSVSRYEQTVVLASGAEARLSRDRRRQLEAVLHGA